MSTRFRTGDRKRSWSIISPTTAKSASFSAKHCAYRPRPSFSSQSTICCIAAPWTTGWPDRVKLCNHRFSDLRTLSGCRCRRSLLQFRQHLDVYSTGDPLCRQPITGIADCERATCDHAAPQPSNSMNSRRLMCSPQAEDHTLPHREKAILCITAFLSTRRFLADGYGEVRRLISRLFLRNSDTDLSAAKSHFRP